MVLDRLTCLTEELAANEAEMKVYTDALVFDIDQRARALSSISYGWCAPYRATMKLTELWLAQN
jgi:hypothetical protein